MKSFVYAEQTNDVFFYLSNKVVEHGVHGIDP